MEPAHLILPGLFLVAVAEGCSSTPSLSSVGSTVSSAVSSVSSAVSSAGCVLFTVRKCELRKVFHAFNFLLLLNMI